MSSTGDDLSVAFKNTLEGFRESESDLNFESDLKIFGWNLKIF